MSEKNPSIQPIVRRRDYWPSGVVAGDIDLLWNDVQPREISVNVGGDLNVLFDDGLSHIISKIPTGRIFVDSCWVKILTASSTAYAISVGW